jgi:hypothetical protein
MVRITKELEDKLKFALEKAKKENERKQKAIIRGNSKPSNNS